MFTRDLSYMVFSQNYVSAFVTTREGKLTKATEGIALKYHSTLLIWGLIYGLGSRNPRRLLEILYLGFFFICLSLSLGLLNSRTCSREPRISNRCLCLSTVIPRAQPRLYSNSLSLVDS